MLFPWWGYKEVWLPSFSLFLVSTAGTLSFSIPFYHCCLFPWGEGHLETKWWWSRAYEELKLSPTSHMEMSLANRHVSDLGSTSFPVKLWMTVAPWETQLSWIPDPQDLWNKKNLVFYQLISLGVTYYAAIDNWHMVWPPDLYPSFLNPHVHKRPISLFFDGIKGSNYIS